MNASTSILRALLKRGDVLEQFSEAQTREVLRILEQANDEIVGKIASTKGAGTREWLGAVKADIDEIYRAAMERARVKSFGALHDLAEDELAVTAETLDRYVLGVSFTTPSTRGLWASVTALPAAEGSTLAELFDAMRIGSSQAVVQALQVGMAEGETIDQMVRRVRGEVVKPARWARDENGRRVRIPGEYSGGAMDTTTQGARALVRTATMHVSNAAREALYQANADIIKGYQYVATLDADDCIVCGAYDGTGYGLDEARPSLPLHPHCRCLYVPVLKSWQELGIALKEAPAGTRASMDGQVPENETYSDRLRKASPERRVAMLGPSRARLYEQGVPLSAMVEGGKILTLDDIAQRSKKGEA